MATKKLTLSTDDALKEDMNGHTESSEKVSQDDPNLVFDGSLTPLERMKFTPSRKHLSGERTASYGKKRGKSRRSVLTKVALAAKLAKNRKKKHVDESHPHFITSRVIRTGIRNVLEKHSLNTSNNYEVNQSSIEECWVDTFTLKNDQTFSFKTYAPTVFAKLRRMMFGIEDESYAKSLGSDKQYLDFQSNSKSGQFFFFSDDEFYILKTLAPRECRWMKAMLKEYVDHFESYPKSLLCKICGMYRVKQSDGNKTHLIVMRSTFDTILPMSKKFDLKGSTVGRAASDHDLKKLSPVLKDLDLEASGIKLYFGSSQGKAILEQLNKDTQLLARLNKMDYSLMLGIYSKDEAEEVFDNDTLRAIFKADNCLSRYDCDTAIGEMKYVYFLGLIDFLQGYNSKKRMEKMFKSFRYKAGEISVLEPNAYARRMNEFISRFIA